MDKLDQTYQEKTTIQSLVESAGMRVFKADLSDCVKYADNELDIKGFVSDARVAKFNFDLGRKAGLEMVLNILQGYEDDLIGDDVKPPKK